jgi:hypothetical protein
MDDGIALIEPTVPAGATSTSQKCAKEAKAAQTLPIMSSLPGLRPLNQEGIGANEAKNALIAWFVLIEWK